MFICGIALLLFILCTAGPPGVSADTAAVFEKAKMRQFKNGVGTVMDLPIAGVFSQVTVEFETMVCNASPVAESVVERELCLDLSPSKCDVKCKNGTAYAMDDAVSFVTLFVVRASLTCDVDGNTRLQCAHLNTEPNKMLFTCPRELAYHLLVKSPFAIKSVTATRPPYPKSWVDQDWILNANAVMKGIPSISLTNGGSFFELTGPTAFPVLMANLPKPPNAPPCHQNVFMAGTEVPAKGGGRLLALSTTQHYDTRNDPLIGSAVAWLAKSTTAPADSSVVDISPENVAKASDQSKTVFVWRVPHLDAGSAAAVANVVEELGKRLREGRGVLIFFGTKTRWESVEKFLANNGLHYLEDQVSNEDRQITIVNRIMTRLVKVYKNMRIILTDMTVNEVHWDRNPSWIVDKEVLKRKCRDDVLLQSNPADFQALLARALCNNRDIVSFMPCTFQPACADNTCGLAVASGRPCLNKIQHFDFYNHLLNLLTDRPECLSRYDVAGVYPGPVRNLAKHTGNFRVQLGKAASSNPLTWEPHLVQAGLAYGYGNNQEMLSTGLYLPPLTRARVRIVSAHPTGGTIDIYVGYNLDVLSTKNWYGERTCLARPWRDMSQVYSSQSFNSSREVEMFSPFGGLIHVIHRMPDNVANYDGAEFRLKIDFYGVVQAPYVDVKTAATPRHLAAAASPEESPAPWGEFRTGFGILGAPSSGFSRVDANTLVALQFLERTARLSVLLGGPSYGHWRLQIQQRINTDVDLQCYNVKCRGYSGNPLYLYVDWPTDRHNTDGPDGTLLDGKALLADRVPNSRDVLYHELGHNYSPMSTMFGIENREVAADFNLVVLRRHLHGLDLVNSPFLFSRYFDHRVPLDDRSLCKTAAAFNWNRVPTTGDLIDLAPALIIIDYFGLSALAEAQRLFMLYLAKGPLESKQLTRAASAVFSNVTGFNLQPIFAFFNYPIDPSLKTGSPEFDQLLAQEPSLPAFFPAGSWVANCLPERLQAIEQRFGGRLVRSSAHGGAAAAAADAKLFEKPYFTEESPHEFSRERLTAASSG